MLSLLALFLSTQQIAMCLEAQFGRATEFVRTSKPGDGVAFDSAVKLEFYGLYKQATVGDNDTPQPWAIKVEARAKWEAWAKCKGMSKEEAMAQYVQRLREYAPQFA